MVAFIQNYRNQHGFPPSLRDIAQGCNLNISTVLRYRQQLVSQGRLSHIPGRSRSLRVLPAPANMEHIVEHTDT